MTDDTQTRSQPKVGMNDLFDRLMFNLGVLKDEQLSALQEAIIKEKMLRKTVAYRLNISNTEVSHDERGEELG